MAVTRMASSHPQTAKVKEGCLSAKTTLTLSSACPPAQSPGLRVSLFSPDPAGFLLSLLPYPAGLLLFFFPWTSQHSKRGLESPTGAGTSGPDLHAECKGPQCGGTPWTLCEWAFYSHRCSLLSEALPELQPSFTAARSFFQIPKRWDKIPKWDCTCSGSMPIGCGPVPAIPRFSRPTQLLFSHPGLD